MTALTLLSLPDELLIQILSHLSPSDLLAAQLTSRYLNTTVTNSIVLQYQTVLKAAQYTDNPFSPLSISDRLAVLKRREEAWASLRPTFTKRIEVQHQTSGIYDIAGGAYHSGDERRGRVLSVQLPVDGRDEREWRMIDMGPKFFVVDVALCVYEHDLIAVVTTSPHSSEPATYTAELHLLQFSASSSSSLPTPHPLAAQSSLHILDSPHERLHLPLEIVADHLVLVLLSLFTTDEPDRVLVHNWRSGRVVARFSAPHGSYYGLVFLTEHWFLLPNAREGRLEIYEIPTGRDVDVDDAPGIGLTPIHILALPALAQGHSFSHIMCRGEPNPIGEGSTKLHMTMPCYPSPEDAIISFVLNVGAEPVQFGNFAPFHAFSMYVHRRAVIEVCRRDSLARSAAGLSNMDPSTSTSTPLPIPYQAWGPPITRWFNTDEVVHNWITTTAGQRAAIISAPIQGQAHPYVVLDFNQGNVQRAKKALGHPDEQDNLSDTEDGHEGHTTGLMVIDEEADDDYEIEDEEDDDDDWADVDSDLSEDLDEEGQRNRFIKHRNEHPEYAFVHRSSTPLDHEMDLDTDDPNPNSNPNTHEYPSSSQTTTNSASLPPPNRWLGTGFLAIEPKGLFDPSERPVGGSLPYVACASAEGYMWDGVMMDGERVVGVTIRGPDSESRERLKVDVFG